MKCFLCVILLTISFYSKSQTIENRFKGSVYDSLGHPIPYAKILLFKYGVINKIVSTNELGLFNIDSIEEHCDVVLIKADGFYYYAFVLTEDKLKSFSNKFILIKNNETVKIYRDDEFNH